jgi:hypothetical protein
MDTFDVKLQKSALPIVYFSDKQITALLLYKNLQITVFMLRILGSHHFNS